MLEKWDCGLLIQPLLVRLAALLCSFHVNREGGLWSSHPTYSLILFSLSSAYDEHHIDFTIYLTLRRVAVTQSISKK